MTKKILQHYITINNRKFSYSMQRLDTKTTRVYCEAANIDQPFLNEDIPSLLIDLPNLIIAEQEHKQSQSKVVRFRVSEEDRKRIQKKALARGYTTISSFLRDLALQD